LEIRNPRNIKVVIMDERRGERREDLRLRMDTRREERRRIESRDGIRGRMEELGRQERDERPRIEQRRDLRELINEWRNEGREERQERESRGHMGPKRERPDEMREHRTEKRQRSDGGRVDGDCVELHRKFSPLLNY
jgi:hypothetical protein